MYSGNIEAYTVYLHIEAIAEETAPPPTTVVAVMEALHNETQSGYCMLIHQFGTLAIALDYYVGTTKVKATVCL